LAGRTDFVGKGSSTAGRDKKSIRSAKRALGGADLADNSDEFLKDAPLWTAGGLDGFLALTTDTLYRTNAEGRIIFASPAAKSLLGYSVQEITGQLVSDLHIDPDEEANFLRRLKDEDGQISSYDVALRHRDGHEVRVSGSGHYWFDENGEIAGIEGIARDISESREVAEKLRKSEARLVEAQRIARLGYWDRDLITDELWWSTEVYDILGLEPGDQPVSFEPYLTSIDPDNLDDQDWAKKARERAIDGLGHYSQDHRITRPDGEERVVHVEGQVSRDGAGKPIRFSGTCQDITERMRIEVELRQSRDDLELRVKERTQHLEEQIAETEAAKALAQENERRLGGVVNTAADGIITIDDRGTIETFNIAAETIFGYRAEEVVGKKINMLMPLRHRQEHDRYVDNFLAGGEARIIGIGREVEGLRKDGSKFPMELAVSELQLSDKIVFTGIVRDISERRELEDTLRISEERFRDFTESATDWNWETDADHNLTYTSIDFFARSGGAEKDILGLTQRQVAKMFFDGPGSDATETWDEYEAILLSNRKFRDVERRLTNDDGTISFISVSGRPLFGEDGTFLGYRGTSRDFTSLKKAEEAAQYLSAAIEELDANISLYDAEDRLVLCNRKGRLLNQAIIETRMPGTTFEEHLRALADHGLMPKAVGREEEWIEERLEQHRNPGRPFEAARHDGTWHRMHEQRLPDGGIISIGTDISDRKVADQALEASEQRFKDFANAASDWFWEMDENLRFTYQSNRLREIGGSEPEDLLGKTWQETNDGYEDNDSWRAFFADLDARKAVRDFRYRYVMSDGSIRHYSISGIPVFDDDGQFNGYRGSGTDITELAHAETNAVLARIAAEKATRAKSDFLSSMSHELRTPMNAILGFGQLLDTSRDPLNRSQKAQVRHILSAGEHLLNLINQVLELSKIETGTDQLSMGAINSEDVLEGCLSLIRSDASNWNITIERNDLGQFSPFLWTDGMRLKQILLNLLSNAVKYNRQDGKIIVGREPIAGNMLRISITDTGDGIPKEKQDKVFEPFNRLGRESGNIEGTGIGLTVTKQLVELLEGRIGFISEAGVGSTFWIEIPLHKGGVPEQAKLEPVVNQERRQEGRERKSRTILYVEDNLASAQLMEEIVRQTFDGETELTIAVDAEQGLALAEKNPPDIVLMDLNLPGINGFDALERLRRFEKTSRIPVIALTADAMPHQVKNGHEAGFYAYLTKPVDVAEVQQVIRDAWTSTHSEPSN
jgi:PAS domain S-box-containing protein